VKLHAGGIWALGLAMALPAGCSSSSDAAPAPDPAVTTSAAPSEAASGLPSEGPSGLPGETPSALPGQMPSELASGAPGESLGAMPDVVGRRLSDAEAALSAAGLMSVHAVDGSGHGRHILKEDNWIVDRQNPQPGDAIVDRVAVTLGVIKPTDGQQTAEPEPGVIPAVVCHDLQDAQEALRGSGFYVVIAKDGLGRHRYPLLDRDWIVVGQSAPARSRPKKSAVIELTVVKFGEPTGSSGCKS
jgi:hypothetical protein